MPPEAVGGERRFACTGCGRCCEGNDAEHYVALAAGEEEALGRFLGLVTGELRTRHLVRLGPRRWGIRLLDGACSLLDGERRCSVYQVRPLQCRSYPFWQEVAGSDAAWEAEAAQCEGIGRGEAVAWEEIRRWFAEMERAGG